MNIVVRTDEEIQTVIEWIFEAKEKGQSHYHGLNYEDGLDAMLLWLTEEDADDPMG